MMQATRRDDAAVHRARRARFPLAQSAAILCCAAAIVGAVPNESSAGKFYWVDRAEQGTADLFLNDEEHPVLRYMYAYDTSTPERTQETFKVYHHVFGPGTDEMITKGPGGLYTHHRGLFVGWMRTEFEDQKLDFWHCKAGAHQRHAKFLELSGDEKMGRMTAEIHWNDAEGKPVIVETRTVEVRSIYVPASNGPLQPGWQIDWESRLESRRGEIRLDGDRQHAGFQFRAAQEVADHKSARYVRPEGYPQKPEAYEVDDSGDPPRHINLDWLAMSYPLGDRQYSIEYFEDPTLPKPSLYSERPYGRFGAFFKTTLTPQKPLHLSYRIRVTTGDSRSQSEIQRDYSAFVDDLKARHAAQGK